MQLYAFVAVDGDGNESIIGMRDTGSWQPLIFSDQERVPALAPIAKRIAHDLGQQVRLIKFSTREEVAANGD